MESNAKEHFEIRKDISFFLRDIPSMGDVLGIVLYLLFFLGIIYPLRIDILNTKLMAIFFVVGIILYVPYALLLRLVFHFLDFRTVSVIDNEIFVQKVERGIELKNIYFLVNRRRFGFSNGIKFNINNIESIDLINLEEGDDRIPKKALFNLGEKYMYMGAYSNSMVVSIKFKKPLYYVKYNVTSETLEFFGRSFENSFSEEIFSDETIDGIYLTLKDTESFLDRIKTEVHK